MSMSVERRTGVCGSGVDSPVFATLGLAFTGLPWAAAPAKVTESGERKNQLRRSNDQLSQASFGTIAGIAGGTNGLFSVPDCDFRRAKINDVRQPFFGLNSFFIPRLYTVPLCQRVVK